MISISIISNVWSNLKAADWNIVYCVANDSIILLCKPSESNDGYSD